MSIKGFIFDFDGLILETEMPSIRVWQEIYRAHQVELPLDRLLNEVGTTKAFFDPFEYLEISKGIRLDRDELKKQKRARLLDLLKDETVLPGVVDYLTYARDEGKRIGLASSSSHAWVHHHLERLKLIDFFDCILTSTDIPNVKPDPDLYLAALERLNLSPTEVIAFEDSVHGITAAKQAGAYCVAVPSVVTRNMDLSRADLIVASLADIAPKDLVDGFEKLTAQN